MSKPNGSSELSAITAQITAKMELPRPHSRPMPAPTQLMHMAIGYQETKAELETLKREAGKALRIRMDLCDEGPHHTSPLDPQRVKNLKANLAENEQSTPALVRATAPEGNVRYEIIAGRHRKAALLELGNDEWDVVIKELDDDAAERLTFYDNLLAPKLSDYAKYLGFARRKASRGFTDEKLAEESGLSRAQVTKLLSFGRLPEAAQVAVSHKPSAVGANLVETLSALPAKHDVRVTEAIKMVIDGRLAAAKAVTWVQDGKPALEPAIKTVIRQGKATFATMLWRPGQVTIRFKDPADADAVQKEIEEMLSRHVKDLKAGS